MKATIVKHKLFVFACIIAAVTFCIMNFSSLGQPSLSAYGNGFGMLDMKLFYTQREASQALLSLPSKGVSLYIQILCIDFLFIASVAYIQAKIIHYVIDAFKLKETLKKFSSLSYLRCFFDVSENLLILIVLFTLPANQYLLSLAGVVTLIKWIVMFVYFIVLACLIAIGISKRKNSTV